MKQYSIRIQPQEHTARCAALLKVTEPHNLGGIVLFDATNVLYFTGFAFAPTERPIAFILTPNGDRILMVPRLEMEHTTAEATVDKVVTYDEYPGDPLPTHYMRDFLDESDVLSSGGRIGADSDGYPWILGYEGPTLTELTAMTYVNLQADINRLQAVKSAAEITLIRESCKWAHLAHMLLQRYTAVGATETEVSLRAGNEATLAMMDAIGPLYRSQSMFGNGPLAIYRGQIGRNSAIPHALANNIVFQPGDTLVTGAGCPMWGYNSELERTMFIGQPNARQQEMFHHAKTAQEIAFEAIRPGALCSDVDTAVRRYYTDNDLMDYWRHHSGHAIGLRYHEGPFLDTGDHTEIREGMIFTVEPGFYTSDLGGFRHSDTVLVTASGLEQMTYYPREWEHLVIGV